MGSCCTNLTLPLARPERSAWETSHLFPEHHDVIRVAPYLPFQPVTPASSLFPFVFPSGGYSRQSLALAWLLLPQEARLQAGCCAPAPAPRGDAHASLAAFPVPLLVAVGLALGALGAVTGAAAAGSRRLGGDGAQQVVPLAQELRLAGQPEAALPQRHARGVLGGARAVVVLQLGQVGRVPLRDELRDKEEKGRR